METDQDKFAAKQCFQKEGKKPRCVFTSTGYAANQHFTSHVRFIDASSTEDNFSGITLETSDEPIDLTTFNYRTNRENFNEHLELKSMSPHAYSMYNQTASENYFSQHEELKLIYTEDDQILMVNIHNDHISSVTCSPEKQFEVLKAAKSLFSKRTRTLYHWMYPNISKQKIKQVVTSSWDSLNRMEKEFYISQGWGCFLALKSTNRWVDMENAPQLEMCRDLFKRFYVLTLPALYILVLGRFGFSNSNLMINPQLDSIKDLRISEENGMQSIVICDKNKRNNSLIDRFPKIDGQLLLRNGEGVIYGKRRKCHRNRQRRKNIHHAYFKDDPELSFELEKFAVNFKLTPV